MKYTLLVFSLTICLMASDYKGASGYKGLRAAGVINGIVSDNLMAASCYWYDGEGPDIPAVGDWITVNNSQMISMYRNDNGLLEVCQVLVGFTGHPIKCYGYTARYCDETYAKPEQASTKRAN